MLLATSLYMPQGAQCEAHRKTGAGENLPADATWINVFATHTDLSPCQGHWIIVTLLQTRVALPAVTSHPAVFQKKDGVKMKVMSGIPNAT